MSNETLSHTTVTVGSSDEANVIINQPTVSRLHCGFLWDGKHWVLHDLESTNGTFVNGVRITQPVVIHASDKVTLGRGVACAVPAQPKQSRYESTDGGDRIAKQHQERPTKILATVSAIALGLFFVLTAMFFWSSLFSNPISNDSVGESSQAEFAGQAGGAVSTSPAGNAGKGATIDSVSSNATPSELQRALWVAIVESSDGKSQKLLGTAIAVEATKLITLASLAYAADLVKDEFPRLRLINLHDPQLSITATTIRLHPNYSKAMQAFGRLEDELKQKINSHKSLDDPSLEDKLKWSERFETVMEAISDTDLAIIESSANLPSVITAGRIDQPQECRLIGFPLINPSPQITNNIKAFSIELYGRISPEGNLVSRNYQVETTGIAAISTVSLACVNSNNEFLGIVTRQATPEGSSVKKISKVIPVRLFE